MKLSSQTVYEFQIYYTDGESTATRYVVAPDEITAYKKLDFIRKTLVKRGFMDFAINPNATVDNDNVIV